jgi:hypothetical protein
MGFLRAAFRKLSTLNTSLMDEAVEPSPLGTCAVNSRIVLPPTVVAATGVLDTEGDTNRKLCDMYIDYLNSRRKDSTEVSKALLKSEPDVVVCLL